MRILGYHGTVKENADDLVAGRTDFLLSSNDGDWLGLGAYFFQDAPDRALAWARRHRCQVGQEAAVVVCELDLTNRLDLLDLTDFAKLQLLYPEFERLDGQATTQGSLIVRNGHAKIQAIKGQSLRLNPVQNSKDRAFINWAISLTETDEHPIEAVRSAFLFGEALYPQSFLFDHSHVQIAMRKHRAIGEPKLFDFGSRDSSRSAA